MASSSNDERDWANMPSELLRDIIRRVERSESQWPGRKHVVACSSVCSSWREITREIVKSTEISNIITFPSSLKLPGPRENAIQCFIQRDKANSTYKLYLGLPPSPVETGKFLMSAKKCRRTASTDYIISLVGDEFSRGSNYVGKVKSNFFGTRFTIYDTQAPVFCKNGSSAPTDPKTGRLFTSNKISPRLPSANHRVADITYELNVLGTRGPRRMHCTLHSIPVSSMKPGGSVPTHENGIQIRHKSFLSNDYKSSIHPSPSPSVSVSSTVSPSPSPSPSTSYPPLPPKPRTSAVADCNSEDAELQQSEDMEEDSIENSPLILKNKAPRWHEQLQCWCLNFRGRVTVASVKNFQLVAASEQLLLASAPAEHDKVLLQFGKIGRDMFTMDFRYPLSAFQAFAICLSSFDNKLACE